MKAADNPWFALFLICSAVFSAFVSVFSIPPLMGALTSAFHISFAKAGLFMTAYTMIPTFGSLLIGFLSDRIGMRRSMLNGLGLLIIAGLLSSMSQNFWEMFVCRVLIGIGATSIFVPGLAMILHLFPPAKLNVATGAFFSSLNLGLSVAMLVTPVLAKNSGWRLPVCSFALVAGIVLAVVLFFTKADFFCVFPNAHRMGPSAANIPSSRWPLILVSAGNFCLFFQSFAMITWLPEYLEQQRNFPPSEAGAISMLLGLVIIPGSVLAGWLADHLGAWVVAVSGTVLCVICPAMLVLAAQLRPSGVSLDTGLVALGTSLLTVPLTSVLAKLVKPEHGGKAVGLILTTGYAGAIVSTYLGGYLLTVSGSSRATFFMCSLSMLFTLVLLGFLRDTYRVVGYSNAGG